MERWALCLQKKVNLSKIFFMAKAVVVVPTYNEIENIAKLLDAVFSLSYDFDVVVVDDNSPDGTGDCVEKLFNTYPDQLFLIRRKKKTGLGTAYIKGFKWALQNGYDYIFEMDADFSHNPEDLIRLLDACRAEGADMAIGSRYVTGVNVINWPMSRVLLSWVASKYVRWIMRLDIYDTTAGFVCYKRNVLEKINLDAIRFVGYAFQIEMKFKTKLAGFSIKEVPVIFTDRTRGESKMNRGIIREAVFGIFKMKFKSVFFKKKFFKSSFNN